MSNQWEIEAYESFESVKAEAENSECYMYILGQFGLWLEDRKDKISHQCYQEIIEGIALISTTTLLEKTLMIKAAALKNDLKEIKEFRLLVENKKEKISRELYQRLLDLLDKLDEEVD